MRPANSAYDAAVNRSLEKARELLKKYGPGEVIPYERLDEEIDDLGFNEVIEPQTVEVAGEGYQVKRENFRYEKLDSKVNGQNAWHIFQYEPGIPGAPGAYIHIGIGTGGTKAEALQELLNRDEFIEG